MSKHFLALSIPTTYNPKILTIADESEYSTELNVDCATLEIFVPGFNAPAVITQTPGFNSRISACAMGLQTTQCGELQADLPDGIYIIRYSVSPNDKVFVEYNHLRLTGILNSYYVALGDVQLEPCSPSADVEKQLKELSVIESYIQAARIKVEDQHKAKEGMDLLIYAKERLDRFLKNPCC